MINTLNAIVLPLFTFLLFLNADLVVNSTLWLLAVLSALQLVS